MGEYNQPAGLLRHRIVLQAETNTKDSIGGITKGYSDLATVWARIRAISGRELIAAQQVDSRVSHEITIRHFNGLTPLHRIKFGTRIFNIESVRDIEERGKKQIIQASEDTSV